MPDLIHLVYHGNQNTHWWAQISLVRSHRAEFRERLEWLGRVVEQADGQPPYNPEIIRWWSGQAAPDELKSSLEESDRKFLNNINPKPAAESDIGDRIREATPLMNSIRENWAAAFAAVQTGETSNAIVLLESLEPRIKEFETRMEGTALEPGAHAGLDYLKALLAALQKNNLEKAKQIAQEMLQQGKRNEEQLKSLSHPNG